MNKTIKLDKEYPLNFTAHSVKELEKISGKTLGEIFEIATSTFIYAGDKTEDNMLATMLKSKLMDVTFVGQLVWAGIDGAISLEKVYKNIPLNRLMTIGTEVFTAFMESIMPEGGEAPETDSSDSTEPAKEESPSV